MTTPPDPCRGKVVYGSERLAGNAAELHGWAYPSCDGVRVYRCGDHYHIGHPTRASREACLTSTEQARRRLPYGQRPVAE